MNGIINLNKPSGISSAHALNLVKRKLGLSKAGFLGTLDPAASGVLIILVGGYTKRADELHQDEKVYRSTFEFCRETTTLDCDGETVATTDIIPTKQQIEVELRNLVGNVEIEVPKFSAVHINGKRAYDLARAGIDFAPPKKVVKIRRFELLEQRSEKEFFFEIECETGTYIRSLAKLLAQKLGTLAIASTIIRTRVGNFDIMDAKTLDDITINDIKEI